MIDINWQPNHRQLIQFGWIAAIAIPAITAFWTRAAFPATGIALGIGLALGVIGTIRPSWLKPLFVGLTVLTFPIGLVIGEVALTLIFLLVFTPMAILFRLIRRDRLERTMDRDTKSYWTDKPQPRGVQSYFRQW